MLIHIRFIPQGKVENNLKPDRLVCPKTQRSQSLQTTIILIARPLSYLFMVFSCACFGQKHSPLLILLFCTSDIAAVVTIFNVFGYDVVWAHITFPTLSGCALKGNISPMIPPPSRSPLFKIKHIALIVPY